MMKKKIIFLLLVCFLLFKIPSIKSEQVKLGDSLGDYKYVKMYSSESITNLNAMNCTDGYSYARVWDNGTLVCVEYNSTGSGNVTNPLDMNLIGNGFNISADSFFGNNTKTATFVIAASNSLNKETADYICDGNDDGDEIEAAMNALPSGGGKVILLEGDYNISTRIAMENNVHLLGSGYGTKLQSHDDTYAIYIEYFKKNIRIENLYLNHSAASYGNAAIYMRRGIIGIVLVGLNIESKSTGIYGWNTAGDDTPSEISIFNNKIDVDGNINSGIWISSMSGFVVSNNIISCNSGTTSYGLNTGGHNNIMTYTQNVISGCTEAMYLQQAENTLVANNIITGANNSGVILNGQCNDTMIIGNIMSGGDYGVFVNINTGISYNTLISSNRIFETTTYAIRNRGTNTMISNNLLIGNTNTISDEGTDTTITNNFPGGSSMEIQSAQGQEIKMKPEGNLTVTLWNNLTNHSVVNYFPKICINDSTNCLSSFLNLGNNSWNQSHADSLYDMFNFSKYFNQGVNTTSNITVNNLNVTGIAWGLDCAEGNDKLIARFNTGVTGANGETGTLTTTNLKGIWHFEEGTGNPTDDSGNGRTLTNNGADWTADGKYGSALDFELDNTDELTIADNINFDAEAQDLTMGMWIKAESWSGTFNMFMGKTDSVWRGFYWTYVPASSIMKAYFGSANTNTANNGYDSTLNPSAGSWHFITLRFNTSDDSVRFGLDGTYETISAGEAVGSIDSTGVFSIGALTSNYYFDGIIDEPFFFKGTFLTDEELDILQANRWWGRTYLDGKFGQGYYGFTGNSLSYPTAGNIVKDQGTIEMWVKPSWDGDDGVNHYFFDVETASNVNRISIYKSLANSLRLISYDSGGLVKQSAISVDGDNFAANTWHHIAGTWDNGDVNFYLNGNSVGGYWDNGGAGMPLTLNSNMYIGRDATSQATEAQAIIDEFKIFDTALNATQIKQHYLCNRPIGEYET